MTNSLRKSITYERKSYLKDKMLQLFRECIFKTALLCILFFFMWVDLSKSVNWSNMHGLCDPVLIRTSPMGVLT